MRYLLILCTMVLSIHASDTISYTFSSWPPVTSLDENDSAWGIYPDLVRELFEKRLDIPTKAVQLPWKRAQLSVEIGTVDFIITVPTEERLKYAEASDSAFYKLFLHVFTYKDHPKLAQMQEITSAKDIYNLGLTPVTNLGNGWHKKNIDSYGIETKYVPAETNAVAFLSMKRADLTIESLEPMIYELKKKPAGERLVDTGAKFGPIKMHLLLSKESSFINRLPEINATFAEMLKDGTVEKILKKYQVLD